MLPALEQLGLSRNQGWVLCFRVVSGDCWELAENNNVYCVYFYYSSHLSAYVVSHSMIIAPNQHEDVVLSGDFNFKLFNYDFKGF